MSDPRPALPNALVFWTGVTCGLVATLALQILLNQRGIPLAAVWREAAAGGGLSLRSALVWWVIAGTAFAASAAVAALLVRLPPPWHGLRLVQSLAAAVAVAVLAEVAQRAGQPQGVTAGMHVLSSLAAAGVGTLMAMFGAFFARPR